MKKQNSFAAYILIGIGIYFLVRQLNLPELAMFNSWPLLISIIGISLLLHSYTAKDYPHLFSGTIVLGIGIHFYGLDHFGFWIDHWAMYPLIVGIAFIVRFSRTKTGWIPGIIFSGASLVIVFSEHIPSLPEWTDDAINFLEKFWPVIFIVLGIILLKKKK